jgi:hypothetical protein
MDHKAALLALILVSSSLAGCTGDPGEGGGDEFDSEALQDLIDENLQDFMNNTSITVNNHFYNNTTYEIDNTDNSVSNINGSGVGSASTMQMFRVDWDRGAAIIGYDVFNHIITLEGSNQVGNNSTTFAAWAYNGNLVEFTGLTCIEWFSYYIWSSTQWGNWLYENYGSANSETDSNLKYQLEQHFENRYSNDGELFDQCGIGQPYYNYDSNVAHLFDIKLQYGQALTFSWLPNGITVDMNCDDGYGTGMMGNGTSSSEGSYFGGQANCTVTGSTSSGWKLTYDWQHDDDGRILYDIDGDGIGDTNSSDSGYRIPEFYVRYGGQGDVPESTFSVYFLIHDVEVYDPDSE